MSTRSLLLLLLLLLLVKHISEEAIEPCDADRIQNAQEDESEQPHIYCFTILERSRVRVG